MELSTSNIKKILTFPKLFLAQARKIKNNSPQENSI